MRGSDFGFRNHITSLYRSVMKINNFHSITRIRPLGATKIQHVKTCSVLSDGVFKVSHSSKVSGRPRYVESVVK